MAKTLSGRIQSLGICGVRFSTDGQSCAGRLAGLVYAICMLSCSCPALKSVALARRQLGIRTFFNMLGPLFDPIQPRHRLMGMYYCSL